MKWIQKTMLALAAVSLNACVTISGEEPKTNISAESLENLITGRVTVFHDKRWRGPNGSDARAAYYYPDGTSVVCGMNLRKKVPAPYSNEWKVVEDERYGALLGYPGTDGQFDPDHRALFYPLSVNTANGKYTVHSYDRGRWIELFEGHVQDSWPAVMVERCPNLRLPTDLKINKAQVAAKYSELVKQDVSVFQSVPTD